MSSSIILFTDDEGQSDVYIYRGDTTRYVLHAAGNRETFNRPACLLARLVDLRSRGVYMPEGAIAFVAREITEMSNADTNPR